LAINETAIFPLLNRKTRCLRTLIESIILYRTLSWVQVGLTISWRNG